FGQFLCWRADLLGGDYLRHLRRIRVPVTPLPASEIAAILKVELGLNAPALVASLERQPCWNTLARCASRTQFQGRTIVAHVDREPIPDTAFDAFEAGLRLIEDEKIKEVIRP